MATANREIADALIRHQMEIVRLGGGMGRRIIALLNRAEPDLREKILRRLDVIQRNGGIDAGPETTLRLQRLQQQIRNTQVEIFDAIRNETTDTLVDLARQEVDFTDNVVRAALPVLVDFQRPTLRRLRSIVTSRPFQGRVLRDWVNQFEANDRRRMMDQIRIGMVQDETPTEIARRIFGSRALGFQDGVRQISRRGAQALAQTATNAIAQNARAAYMEDNSDVIPEEVYLATLDARTSDICRALDGKRFPVGKGPRPPLHINCRSTRVPVIDGEVIGERPAVAVTEKDLRGLSGRARRAKVKQMVGTVPAAQTYEQWLRTQSTSFQDDVLGPTRAALFRKGEVSLDRFVDINTGRRFTIEELKQRDTRAFKKAGLLGNRSRRAASDLFREARQDVIRLGRDSGHEHLIAYDLTTGLEIERRTDRSVNSVQLSGQLRQRISQSTAEVVLHHNHPGSSSLSRADLRIAGAFPGVASIVAHGHDGSQFEASKVDLAKLDRAYDGVEERLRSVILEAIEDGDLPVSEANGIHFHIVNDALARLGIQRYRARFTLPRQRLLKRRRTLIRRATAAAVRAGRAILRNDD